MIGAASGEYKRSSFSNEDCNFIIKAWTAHKNELGKTKEELLLIEEAADAAGMFAGI
jgi:hypothetical protein